MTAAGRSPDWRDTLARTGRVAAIAAAAAVGTAALAVVIFYDADFYAVRDRWEHFKRAMFGEWTPTTRRPGRGGGETSPTLAVRTLDDVFSDLANVGVFETVPVVGTALKVVTGSTYASSRELLANTAGQRWCYVLLGTGNVTTRIELGAQTADAPPVYPPITAIPPADLSAAGLDAERVRGLARSHCRFGT